MDSIGTAMGLVTIPMALLSAGSILGGSVLLADGQWQLVAYGLLAAAVGLIVAQMAELLAIQADRLAWKQLRRVGPWAGRSIGVFGAAIPMLAILIWQYQSFSFVMSSGARALPSWLWAYGVATVPWTIFALRVGSDRRTLCGIRAYAGHLGFWLLSLAIFAFGAPIPVAVAAMTIPAILPFVVGMLLATADRDALHNVRI